MVIYSESRLIFGWKIDYETIKAYADKINTNVDVYYLNYMNSLKFPNVFFVCTHPFYDAGDDEKHYFISLLEDSEKQASLDQIMKVHSQNLESALAFIKNELGIESFGPPMIYSVPHIW